jgi:replicative DNA helicase
MDLDKAFASALVYAGRSSLVSVLEKGINTDLLAGDGKTVFDFILDYNTTYGSWPTPEIIEGKLGVTIENPPASVEFFSDEILNRSLHSKIREGLRDPLKLLESRDPRGAYNGLEELMFELRKTQVEQARIQSLPALGKEVLEHYEKMKGGARGVPTPWPSINDATLGFWPEDLIVVVAKSGIGKTWLTIVLTNHAWSNGHSVLYCTTEMSRQRIAMRFFAARFKLNYDLLRRGQLPPMEEEAFKKNLDDILNEKGLWVVGGGFDFRMESFAAAIDDAKPAMVIMDGAYLMKSSGNNRTEQAANSFNDLKRIAKAKNVPIIVTTQMNRGAKKNVGNTIQADNIALTDVAMWNSDVILGLLQTDDMRRDRRLTIKPMKLRDGVCGDVEINWDLDNMMFDELPKSNSPSSGSDEFGVGDLEQPF